MRKSTRQNPVKHEKFKVLMIQTRQGFSLLKVSCKLELLRAGLAFSFKISEIWALPRKHLSLSKEHFSATKELRDNKCVTCRSVLRTSCAHRFCIECLRYVLKFQLPTISVPVQFLIILYDCLCRRRNFVTPSTVSIKNVQVQYVYHCCLFLNFDQNYDGPKAKEILFSVTSPKNWMSQINIMFWISTS